MKTFQLILLFFFITIECTVFAQKNTNQTDNHGFKFGCWKVLYKNGKVKEEGDYTILKKGMNAEELFMMGIAKEVKVTKSVKNGEWKYYDEHGVKIKTEKWSYGRLDSKNKYYYKDGKLENIDKTDFNIREKTKKPIEIKPLEFDLYDTIGKSDEVHIIEIESTIEEKTSIKYEASSDAIELLENYSFIAAGQKIAIPFKVRFDKGKNSDYIVLYFELNGQSFNTVINIHRYGYDLSTILFSKNKEKIESFDIAKDSIFFVRKTEECELKIYPYYNDNDFEKIKNYKIKETLVFPLSLEFNMLDISNLPKDRYLFRIVNYRDKVDRFVIVNRK